jgi:hypothetical protein
MTGGTKVLAEERLNETSPATGGGPPEPPRRPYWPAALFVVGLLVALLGAAVVLNDRFRPRPTIETPGATVLSATPPAAAAAPSTPPTAQPTAVPTPSVAPTAVPTPTAVLTTGPSPTSAVPKATSSAAPLAGSPAATAAPSVLTPLQKEIIEGYLRYWEVRIRAYYELDVSHLPEVMAGAELQREEGAIRDLRAQGRAAKWDVEHNFRILKATPDEAEVYDEYVNRSVFIDASTKQEIPAKSPPPVRKISFFLKKGDGSWKVVDGARHE